MEIQEAIKKVSGRENLTEQETKDVFNQIMSGDAADAQIKDLLSELSAKGETVEEIVGAAQVMRDKVTRIFPMKDNEDGPLLDTCGTGGTGKNIFNVSTISAFVAAACGVKVAKHGNRAVSGSCGSADLLEELGVKIDVSPAVTEKCIKEEGIGFMFAPLYHSAMKYAAGPRKELGIRTIFNILGPLSNPAFADHQVLGVFDEDLTEVMAEVLGKLGTKRAFVVHGRDGLDEATINDMTKITELNNGELETFNMRPEDFGINTLPLKNINGGTKEENAKIALSVLNGEGTPYRDMVIVNATLALVVSGKAKDMISGIDLSTEALDSGKAKRKLEAFIKITNDEVK